MDENLRISYETWQMSSSYLWSYKNVMRELWKFWLFGQLHHANVEKSGKYENLNIPHNATWANNQNFQRFCRTITWTHLPSFITNGPVDSEIFVGLCEKFVFFTYFPIFSQKSAHRCQLRHVRSQQEPFRVERQMSTFWKLDNQGYNIGQK